MKAHTMSRNKPDQNPYPENEAPVRIGWSVVPQFYVHGERTYSFDERVYNTPIPEHLAEQCPRFVVAIAASVPVYDPGTNQSAMIKTKPVTFYIPAADITECQRILPRFVDQKTEQVKADFLAEMAKPKIIAG